MELILQECSLLGLSFVKRVSGIVINPYRTYRRIIEKGQLSELFLVGLICVFYFLLASVVKVQSFHPFLLTQQFFVVFFGAAAGFILLIALLYGLGTAMGGKGKWEKIAIAWGYSYLPTTLWFLATSVLYLLLPPPRTQTPLGILFSLLYLLFSTVLFFWKIELYYLTLRFGLRLDLRKIMAVTAVILPVAGVYSYFMFRMGIFRIPFL